MRFYEYLNERTIEKSEISEIIESVKRQCKPFINDFRKEKPPGFLLSGRKGLYHYFIGNVRKNRIPKDTSAEVHNFVNDYLHDEFGIWGRSETLFVTSKYGDASSYGDSVYIIFPIGKYKIIWNPDIQDMYTEFQDTGEFNEFFFGDIEDANYENYEMEYGPGREGYWEFRGEQYAGRDIHDAVDAIIDQNEEFEDTYRDRDIIYQEIEWIPDKTYEEWYDDMISQQKERVYRLMGQYTTGDLKQAIVRENEIMLYCREYYALRFNPFNEHLIEELNFNWMRK